MLEKKSILLAVVIAALIIVSVPSVLFHNAINKYVLLVNNWGVATSLPPKNAQLPPMHQRTAINRTEVPQPELRFAKFTIKSKKAKAIKLAGDFNNWNWDALALVKKGKDTWGTIVPLPAGVYGYLYEVDGLRMLDPMNPETTMHNDQKVSALVVK